MDEMLGLEPLVAVLKDRLSPIYSLTLDMLKQHKTEKVTDVQAWVEQYLVRCPTCDGNTFKTWRPQDEEYKCAIWIRAEKLGLV
jgi:hypothetical protein